MNNGTTKTCNGCKSDLDLSEFSRQHTSKDGLRTICKTCLAEKARPYLLKKRFGITHAEYETLLAEQGNGCALCSAQEPGGRWDRFAVDHCHDTGRVRGLLCYSCNFALGLLGDNEDGLARALAYVRNPVAIPQPRDARPIMPRGWSGRAVVGT